MNLSAGARLGPHEILTIQARNLLVLTPDDQRFLAVTALGNEASIPTTVALNWSAAFRK